MNVTRVWHNWMKWECYPAGFYAKQPPAGMDADGARVAYRDFLSDDEAFWAAMERVVSEWPVSCEHFLTNLDSNRLAWLGQSAMCIATGVSSAFRGGFRLLDASQQRRANNLAACFLDRWERKREREQRRENQAVRRDVAGSRLSRRHPGRGPGCTDATTAGPVLQGDLFGAVTE
jgi:hypothetical protein